MANLSVFNVGDDILTYGADMGCHKCVVRTKVLGRNEEGIILEGDGCRIIYTWDTMQHFNDYFPYSEEQERAMQEKCDREYNEWREACKRQAERAKKFAMERDNKTKGIIKAKGVSDGTHTTLALSGKGTFFRWKSYNIVGINENLDMLGVAEDGDTMYLNIHNVPVPTQLEVEREVDAYDTMNEVA